MWFLWSAQSNARTNPFLPARSKTANAFEPRQLSFCKRFDSDAKQSGNQNHFDDRSSEEDDSGKRQNDQDSLPGLARSVPAHAPGSDCDQGNNRRIESVEELLSVWQRAKSIVKDRQRNHHQHRRQNESAQRDCRAAPAAQPQTDIS